MCTSCRQVLVVCLLNSKQCSAGPVGNVASLHLIQKNYCLLIKPDVFF